MDRSASAIKQDIIAYAHSLGFGRVGVTSVDPLNSAAKSLGEWLEEGCAGEMGYMEKNWETRSKPGELLPGARSVIALAVNYYNAPPSPGLRPPSPLSRERDTYKSESGSPLHTQGRGVWGEGEGRIARYAWGKDYHRIIQKRLEALVRYMEALAPAARFKSYVDTGPLLERAVAQKAGLGFIGKNTMLITRGMGSWVFLANVLTTLELPVDSPDARSCGSCTLCIDACPTQAITEPYHLDARRCISYLTIEAKDQISTEMRSKTGDWLFGCDICQEVCPHNTRLPPTPITEFKPEQGVGAVVNLSDVLGIKAQADFDRRFSGTPLKRAKRHRLLRNACLVAVNQKRTDLLPQLEALTREDVHPVVREHARWAVEEMKGGETDTSNLKPNTSNLKNL